MKKILVITYYWPPETGVGVQRIQKFCEYLPYFGYEPVVLTASSKKLSSSEVFSKEENVNVARVYYWFNPASWLSGNKNADVKMDTNRSKPNAVLNYLQYFIWLNFFIPDSKVGWYSPAKRAVDVLMRKFDIKAVMTSGPPFTTHLIGLYARKKFKLPWIVDARDPWVENVDYNYLTRFRFVIKANKILDKRVYANADRVVTIGEKIKELLQTKVSDKEKVRIIYNGYDDSEFTGFLPKKSTGFKIGHYGSIQDDQIPYHFLEGLKSAIVNFPQFGNDFLFDFYGPVSAKARYEIERHLPERNRSFHDSIPRKELIEKLTEEQVLFLMIMNVRQNELVVSSKIFEYIRSGWPVIILGPEDGEAGKIIRIADSGKIFSYSDREGPLDFALRLYQKWKTSGLRHNEFTNPIFERKEQTKQLAKHFTELIEIHSAKP